MESCSDPGQVTWQLRISLNVDVAPMGKDHHLDNLVNVIITITEVMTVLVSYVAMASLMESDCTRINIAQRYFD